MPSIIMEGVEIVKIVSMKIKVSNLTQAVSRSDLTDLFEEFGKVLKVQVLSSERNRMAFIEMADFQSAMEAIEELDGELYMGRHISVQRESQAPIRSQENVPFESKDLNMEDKEDEDTMDDYEDMEDEPGFEKIKRKDYSEYSD